MKLVNFKKAASTLLLQQCSSCVKEAHIAHIAMA